MAFDFGAALTSAGNIQPALQAQQQKELEQRRAQQQFEQQQQSNALMNLYRQKEMQKLDLDTQREREMWTHAYDVKNSDGSVTSWFLTPDGYQKVQTVTPRNTEEVMKMLAPSYGGEDKIPQNIKEQVALATAGIKMPVSHLQSKVVTGPDDKPMLAGYDAATNTYYDDAGKPITNPQPFVKPPQERPVAGISNGRNTFGVYTGKGWTSAATGAPLPDFSPMPTYSQTGIWQPTEGYDAKGNLVPGKFNERTGQFLPSSGGSPAPLPKSVSTELTKEIQTAREADKRLHIMQQNETAALNGDQQAMLSLVANHIGMTLGAQKGARINQAVWDEAVQSAPLLQNVQKKWGPDGYLAGVTLSPEQIRQMVALGQVVRDNQWKQTEDAFSQYGIPINTSRPDMGGGASRGDSVIVVSPQDMQ